MSACPSNGSASSGTPSNSKALQQHSGRWGRGLHHGDHRALGWGGAGHPRCTLLGSDGRKWGVIEDWWALMAGEDEAPEQREPMVRRNLLQRAGVLQEDLKHEWRSDSGTEGTLNCLGVVVADLYDRFASRAGVEASSGETPRSLFSRRVEVDVWAAAQGVPRG